MSQPMKPTDKAYWMLLDDFTSTPVFDREDCYICRDPEFAQMGLPLCYKCSACQGHVPADDTICDDCGEEQMPDYMEPAPETGESQEPTMVFDGTLEDFQDEMRVWAQNFRIVK
jgi:hypothetical protein